ncbi:MAG: hypothetical protein ACRDPF_21810 [Streptosporangiaceae bacterium]
MTEVAVVRRWTPVVLAAALAASVAGLAGGPAYASAGPRPVLSVGGEVTTAASYTVAQLAALPQTTATVKVGGRQVTDTGVLLETLVTNAGPAYPASLLNTKNELLRVTVTVRGAGHRQVTFAVGELDAGFGNHPALLALTQNGHPIAHGPELVVPGDRAPVRFVPRGIAADGPDRDHARHRHQSCGREPGRGHQRPPPCDPQRGPAGPAARRDPACLVPGTGRNADPHRGRPVPARGAGRRPDLADAQHLGRGRGPRQLRGHGHPAEQLAGGRPLQLSLNEDGVALAQPRLVTDGDVKGGRYVSGVVDIYVGTGPAR